MTDYPPEGPGDQGGGYRPTPPPPPPGDYGQQTPGSYPPPPGSYPPPPGNYGAPSSGYGQPGYGSAPGWQGPPLADWANRALAFLVDGAFIIAGYIVILVVLAILSKVSGALAGLVGIVGYLAIFAFAIWQLVVQGQTGQTIGKRVIGVKLVGESTGQPIGAGMSILRQFVHFVDSVACYVGWLFPLWDPKKQTFADKILSTVVVNVPKQPFSITPT